MTLYPKGTKRTEMKKYFTKIIIAFSIIAGAIGSFGFSESYFEISKNLDIFTTLYRELNIYYVDDANPGELIKTGIDAMLKSLDPYTNYIPESKIEDYKMMTTGQYGGIGALIQKHGEYVEISQPYENFGADKAGLRAGDKILEIDGKSVVGKNTSEIRDFLLGQPGTTLQLKIKRPTSDKDITLEKEIVREKVKIKDVPFYSLLDGGIGYIKLSGFTQSASSEVKSALLALKEQGASSIVLDLRGNGGGLLRESVNIVNLFVEKGTKVVHTKGKLKEWNKEYRALSAPVDMDIPLAVLINGSSASASEIVSGSLQDNDRAVIIGTPSFGKGLVQQVRPLSYNSKLKVTVSKYYTPSGRCIQKIDYSNRNEDGEADDIPDSLITEFKTLHSKRPVFDGKGITPDIEVEKEKLSDITKSLLLKFLLFDYVTLYRYKNATIDSPSTFTLSDKDYEAFIDFLSDKDYAYTTDSEDLLVKLEEATKEEAYFDAVKTEYEALKNKLSNRKKGDLREFKEEIKQILENEIVLRYYYQKGQIENTLKHDPVMDEAKRILGNKEVYTSILDGSYK